MIKAAKTKKGYLAYVIEENGKPTCYLSKHGEELPGPWRIQLGIELCALSFSFKKSSYKKSK